MRAAILILPLVLLAACDGKAAGERYKARAAAIDPPKLWSVEVVPAQAGVAPVKVCADSRIHEGLARPAVTAGGAGCRPIGQEVVSGGARIQRCELNGETWVTTAAVSGDLARDFTSVQSAEPVSGAGGYSQTRRYRLIGDCPKDWNVGDSTDQQGNHVKGQSGLLALIGG
ncbi:hypothetical protein [Caulobacter sp. NIBR1757]|uniref:hypothetical protein n=1 Tax=Caulobacter sp. NIBR1757 TaxID=3016000 RepID=UPI0022F02062|nr:hypothetical protein [Caulobacter sp. NIBR1757]WGM38260.1 hypothetical protein AMEJIAPC_01162 [Caulobacter sp. NIBR1757]